MASYIKKEGEKCIFSGDGELIYYVPEKFFDIGLAIPVGERMIMMGMCRYALFDNNGKKLKIADLKIPTTFECRPSLVTKETNYHLQGTKEQLDYRLFHFKKGDELICNMDVPQDIVNVEKFFKLMSGGNLPDHIPYDRIHEYVLENAAANKFNYKVSPNIIGILISELNRDPDDLTKPFRLSAMKDMNNYKAISIIKIPKYTSPYTSITSENADEAIASAMTTKGTAESPLEKVVMG